jgi:hypothetical protein
MARRLRRQVAFACVVTALAGQVVLPSLHVLVHRLEAELARASRPRWRVEATPAVSDESADAAGHAHGGRPHRERHRHPGDDRGGHGVGAPEHLDALLASPAPVVPLPGYRRAAQLPPPGCRGSVATAPAPARPNSRGPPVVS